MSEQAYVRPDSYPEWVNSPIDEALVGNVIGYFGQLNLSELDRRMALATKDACQAFICAQSRQQPTTGKYEFLLIKKFFIFAPSVHIDIYYYFFRH